VTLSKGVVVEVTGDALTFRHEIDENDRFGLGNRGNPGVPDHSGSSATGARQARMNGTARPYGKGLNGIGAEKNERGGRTTPSQLVPFKGSGHDYAHRR